ncbi:MAG: HIT domain-containing protein [bacterium]|nr:HIT domain-containing protein [bacterium]
MHQLLFTPWRYAYITGEKKETDDCFFCSAVRDSDNPERLVVHRTEHHLVVLNRHPYNNGHLMVAPLDHLAQPAEADEAARAEFWPLILEAQRVLGEAYAPHGFNMGMNLGRVAGAGVPGHFHFHLVPRWQGDSNFMAVVGDVRLVPEDLETTWIRLRQLFAARLESTK